MAATTLRLARRFARATTEEGVRVAVSRAARWVLRQGHGELNRLAGVGGIPTGQVLSPGWQALARAGAFHARRLPPDPRPDVLFLADPRVPQSTLWRVRSLAAHWPGAQVRVFDPADTFAAAEAMQTATHLVLCRLTRTDAGSQLLYEARRLGLPVLYDIDDPLMSLPALSGHLALAALGPREQAGAFRAAPETLELMNAADAVSVSTSVLATQVERLSRRPVWLCRNILGDETLSFAAQLAGAPRRPGPARLVLPSGSRGRAPDVAALIPALMSRTDIELTVIGPVDRAALPSGLVRRANVRPTLTYPAYLAALAEADAVLIPLADDPFNACKSAVRALDAFAVGRPVVASPVGELAEVIRPGETGFLARDPADWAGAIDALTDPARIRTMGEAALAWVRTYRGPPSTGTADLAVVRWGRE